MSITHKTRLFLLGTALGAVAAAIIVSLSIAPTTRGEEPAGGPTSIALNPPSQSVAAGNDALVQVNVANVSNLGAWEVALLFDPTVLTYDSYTTGPFLGSTGRSLLCLPALFDQDGDTTPDPGYLRFGCVTTGEPAGPTGSGLLATVRFKTPCAGMSDLAFDLSGLSDPLGSEITHSESGGSVTVTGGGECGAIRPGDVDCSKAVDPVDATLVLQNAVGLLDSLTCPENGDTNGDHETNAIDATLILQYVVGLIDEL